MRKPLLIILSILLGIITNLAIAVGIALTHQAHPPMGPYTAWKTADGAWFITSSFHSITCSRTSTGARIGTAIDPQWADLRVDSPVPESTSRWPIDQRPLLYGLPPHKPGLAYDEFACGFPLHCLWASQSSDQYADMVTLFDPVHVLPLWKTDKQGCLFLQEPPNRVLIPTAPIWSGLALNTMFFGACWSLLLLAVPAARRWRRRRLNLCTRCRYPRAGLPAGPAAPCPECGFPA